MSPALRYRLRTRGETSPWLLTAVGLTCFWLAGRKVWWAWYVGLAGQAAWLAYSVTTGQWGFLVGAFAYSMVYARNAATWTREHRAKAKTVEGE